MGRFLQIAGLVIGLAGLVLQFCISIPASMEAGRSLLGSIVFLFSFFTILTNIGAVLVYTSLLSSTGYAWLPAFAGSRMRAGVAVSITLVFIVYATVLAQLWQPQGPVPALRRPAALRDAGAVRAVVAGSRRRRQDAVERHLLVDALSRSPIWPMRWRGRRLPARCPTPSSMSPRTARPASPSRRWPSPGFFSCCASSPSLWTTAFHASGHRASARACGTQVRILSGP